MIYSNLLTKLFEKKGIVLHDESEKIKLIESYDVYNKKTLGVIHIMNKYGVWDFKYPKARGILCLVKLATPKSIKKSFKVSSIDASYTIPQSTPPFLLDHRLDSLIFFMKQFQDDKNLIKESVQNLLNQ